MARPRPLSGFPEWLPAGRAVERHVLGVLSRVFALHGFTEIETRAVEPLDQLLRKGETSKEVYVLRRLQEAGAAGQGGSLDAKTLGLHFDLTVPLARYVLENAGHLEFPFKRYQCQKVWRGERPQDGRFREFLQADLDVIGLGDLPFHYEVELPLAMAEALHALGIGQFRVSVNNRKLVQGFGASLGVEDMEAPLRWLDKLDKIGPAAVRSGFEGEGLSAAQADAFLRLAEIATDDADHLTHAVTSLAAEVGAGGALLDEGLAELAALLVAGGAQLPGALRANLKIARGLDYYTGSVYETVWLGQESLGSVCSGGRYDSLAQEGSQTYPGVGLSIGVTRLVSRVLALKLLEPSRISPAAVVVAVVDEASRPESDRIAAVLRSRGIPAETAPTAAKFGKQIRYAANRGIPYVWFPASSADTAMGGAGQVRDIRASQQVEADPAVWTPPLTDLAIAVGPPKDPPRD